MELTPVQKEILEDLFLNGDNIPANIADNTGRHPKSLQKVLPDLIEQGLIVNKGRGVYRLTPDGRELARDLSSKS